MLIPGVAREHEENMKSMENTKRANGMQIAARLPGELHAPDRHEDENVTRLVPIHDCITLGEYQSMVH